jgi:uncharacterized membrane protein YczE
MEATLSFNLKSFAGLEIENEIKFMVCDGVDSGGTRHSFRTALEVLVLIVGWVIGGAVGIGTVIFAVTIGPTIQFIASKAGQDLGNSTIQS